MPIQPAPLNPKDLRAGPVRFLLELQWPVGGQTYRFAEVSGLDTSALTDSPRFNGGLTVVGGVQDSIDFTATRPTSRQARVVMAFGKLVDVPARIRQGHDLLGTRGRLYRWVEGTTAIELVVDGRTVGPSWDIKNTVALTLREAPWIDDTALLPEAIARVTSDTWSVGGGHLPDPKIESEFYPIPYGEPGLAGGLHVTPGLYVDTNAPDKLLISRYEVGATQVTVTNIDAGDGGTFAVVQEDDDLGTITSTIDMTNPVAGGPMTRAVGDEYRVDWTGGTAGGGILAADGTAIRGAGSLLRWWLERSHLRWDAGSVEALIPALDQFLISGFAMASPDRRITPWDWIVKELLPLLPIGVRFGGDGVSFALFRPDATVEDRLIELEEGRNIHATGDDPGYVGEADIANEFRLEYQLKHDGKPNALSS